MVYIRVFSSNLIDCAIIKIRKKCFVFDVSVKITELYYISGDCALILHQSTNCNQKHGGFWPNLRHFDVTVSLFSCRTPLTRYLSGKNLSMSRGQWMVP